MRLFVALALEEEIRRGVARFIEDLQGFAPHARWVKAESLHVTLKFIGEVAEARVKDIQAALEATSAPEIGLSFRECGFFPAAKAARVFWIGIESATLAQLACRVEERLIPLGVPKEKRAYSPHLTLARAPGGSGAPGWRKGDRNNRVFAKLQERIARSPAPGFGSMTAREFFLYRSELGRGGARYTKIANFALHAAGE